MKESFIIYSAFYKPISKLSNEQLGRLFRALFSFNLGEDVSVEEDICMAFEFFKNQFEIDERKRQDRIKRNTENGQRGGNPNFRKGKPNPYYSNHRQGITEDNRQLSNISEDKAINDNDNDNDNVNENDNENNNKKKKQSDRLLKEKPSLSDIALYAASIHSHIDANDFINYYEATDWKVQGKPMKNWKLTVQTWTKRDKKERPWLYVDNLEKQEELWQT